MAGSSRNTRRAQRDFTKSKVKKLQRAGLLGDVDLRKPLTTATKNRLRKYNELLTGKATTVKAPTVKEAAHLRKTLGLKGSGKTIVIPKEKHERYSYHKSTGEIVSKRPGYNQGETITKTLGRKDIKPPTDKNVRRYYTIPERTRGLGKLKRQTFSSFDEFLYYMSKYDVRFEDIEDRLEIEEVSIGSRKDKQRQKKIHDEREKAIAKRKRKAPKKKPAKKAAKRARKK